MRTKKCPRCNASAKIDRYANRCVVRCSKCDISPVAGKDRDEAVAAWNKRWAPALTNVDKARRARRELEALPTGHPDRDQALKTWRWYQARINMEPLSRRPRKRATATIAARARQQIHGGTLKSKIDAYDKALTALDKTFAGTPDWSAAYKEVDRLGGILLGHQCRTMAQVLRLMVYARSVGLKLTPEMIEEKRTFIRQSAPTGRTQEQPNTTYEFGIVGSDRVPVVEPRPGNKSRYHRKYPLEIAEVGESILVPGIEKRGEIAGTLAAAQRQYKRRFKTEATQAGLLITRIA